MPKKKLKETNHLFIITMARKNQSSRSHPLICQCLECKDKWIIPLYIASIDKCNQADLDAWGGELLRKLISKFKK